MITDQSARAAGRLAIQIVGDRGSYPLLAAGVPITLAVELNDTGRLPGATARIDQCGEVRFGLAPTVPACALGAGKVTCR